MGENSEASKGSGSGEIPAPFLGREACGIGVILTVLGIVAGFGTATIIVCTAGLFFGLAASRRQIPGIEASDRSLPDNAPVAD
ncbi:hypothetical protein BH24ACT22_BH24ACT22_12240 [soil metagenome]